MDQDSLEADSMEAMAAAMGFSSFGAQQPNAKRRKYNPHLEESASAALPHHGARAAVDHGQGANAIPLGARQAAAVAPAAQKKNSNNKDEISLDDDDEDDPEPQYIDTSRPATSLEPAAVLPPPDADAGAQAHADAAAGGATTAGGGSRGGRYQHGYGRGGYRDQRQHVEWGVDGGDRKPWYEDYYDPSFNINPWEKLERERGLEPLSGDYLTWEESKARWEREKEAAAAAAASQVGAAT
ncbi:hypothetical protein BKA67DRAFT_654617 [Truncatella angustata]|uniref:Uncharacterized protein n=1 Tax=Truncatella angustata TaxID=152316 RepID=A0A9P9A0S1_9PEZI|nr:uncharacterized protein BKA67DRAFT_654617 [Truncatella angustata]KAH6656270.1 hypothetical protein BKA67DRAFT_654617 [Truncatella angustata]KAH8199453.1 hypothetical protein TruAng_006391 [Truncatella angustata]